MEIEKLGRWSNIPNLDIWCNDSIWTWSVEALIMLFMSKGSILCYLFHTIVLIKEVLHTISSLPQSKKCMAWLYCNWYILCIMRQLVRSLINNKYFCSRAYNSLLQFIWSILLPRQHQSYFRILRNQGNLTAIAICSCFL